MIILKRKDYRAVAPMSEPAPPSIDASERLQSKSEESLNAVGSSVEDQGSLYYGFSDDRWQWIEDKRK